MFCQICYLKICLGYAIIVYYICHQSFTSFISVACSPCIWTMVVKVLMHLNLYIPVEPSDALFLVLTFHSLREGGPDYPKLNGWGRCSFVVSRMARIIVRRMVKLMICCNLPMFLTISQLLAYELHPHCTFINRYMSCVAQIIVHRMVKLMNVVIF